MKTQCGLCIFVAAVLCWAVLEPSQAWASDLEHALSGSRSVVVFVALPDRPLSHSARLALDTAWNEIRPDAERVSLERLPSGLGSASALALCVLAPSGELVARRDGAFDAAIAEEWLREALQFATCPKPSVASSHATPCLLFEHAQRAMRLGAIELACAEFTALAEEQASEWKLPARERLARLATEAGQITQARQQLELAAGANASDAMAARVLLTRGLIEFAERKNRAACATLSQAVTALAACHDDEVDRARFESARAQAAAGEESCAIALLDDLGRRALSQSQREAARRFAAELRSPPVTH